MCYLIYRSSISSAMMWSLMNFKTTYQLGTHKAVYNGIHCFMRKVIMICCWKSVEFIFLLNRHPFLALTRMLFWRQASWSRNRKTFCSFTILCRTASNSSKIHFIYVIFWCIKTTLSVWCWNKTVFHLSFSNIFVLEVQEPLV